MDIENIAVRGWKYKRFGWKRSILVNKYASTLVGQGQPRIII